MKPELTILINQSKYHPPGLCVFDQVIADTEGYPC